jgi:hypothetical protein
MACLKICAGKSICRPAQICTLKNFPMHIINLAAKKALENLYESNINDFNALEENQETEKIEEVESNKLSIIYKVNVTIILKI